MELELIKETIELIIIVLLVVSFALIYLTLGSIFIANFIVKLIFTKYDEPTLLMISLSTVGWILFNLIIIYLIL